MKINTQSPLIMLLISLLFVVHFSCTRDSDLLRAVIPTESEEIVNAKNVVDDTFIVSQNGIIVLDVLSNDDFTEQDNVSIKETSSPSRGSIEINNNNTITYTADKVDETPAFVEESPVIVGEQEVPDSVAVDTFTYTTEVANEDQTVTIEEGVITVIITPEENNNTNCVTNGGKAGDTGLKTWCWENVTLPQYSGSKGVSFSNGELVIDSECYEQQITKAGNQLKFRVNPTTPEVGSWCSRDYNMRAEIRTAPWNIRHPKGTEEWFGWSYTFGDEYVIDRNNEWLFFQVHPGIEGESPHTEILVIKDGQFSGHAAGEIYIANAANGKEYHPTGITPSAGERLNIVVHAIWGDASSGLLQIWINGQSVYDKHVATVYSSSPWGGNAKWGIYKWPWAEESGVQASEEQGISYVETSMGSLRIITRRPGDTDYGKNSYALVAPE